MWLVIKVPLVKREEVPGPPTTLVPPAAIVVNRSTVR
jgi:hypothetical protein